MQAMPERETCRPCLRGTQGHFGCCPPALASLGQVLQYSYEYEYCGPES